MRMLDILIPSYNRPAKLYTLLKTGLALDMPDVYFVVIDDGSTVWETIGDLGTFDTHGVCTHFNDPRIIYLRNPENKGLAYSWMTYYTEHAQANYAVSVVDKDVFVDREPILNALARMENDPSLVMTCMPLLQQDPSGEQLFGFSYTKMSGREFIEHFVRDENLQHTGGYAIKRVDAIRRAGLPRSMNLARYGLSDMFGIDIDLVLMLASMGNVDFEHKPYMKRIPMGGMTERFPLSFAYTYYQYAKRTMNELAQKNMASPVVVHTYLGWWHLLILRGMMAVYCSFESVQERGARRLRLHLKLPIHAYIWLEMKRYQVALEGEKRQLFYDSLHAAIPRPIRFLARLPMRVLRKIRRHMRGLLPA